MKVFRTSESERRTLTAEIKAHRAEADAERQRRLSVDRSRTDDLRSFVVNIDKGFAALSAGDLTARMTGAVAPEAEPIRAKFNGTVETSISRSARSSGPSAPHAMRRKPR